MKFEITPEELKRIAEWETEQDQKWAEKFKTPRAYYGASGVSLTYEFTPTSLGVVCKVRHVGGEELDFTEYLDW